MLGMLLNIAACGFHIGYSAPLLLALASPASEMPLTLETETWIASSVAATTLPSFVLITPIAQRFGRKVGHLFVAVPAALACILLYLAPDITTLIVARLISGITCGASMTFGAIIIGEFTSPENRGIYLMSKSVAIFVGIWLVHVLGLFFDWRTTALFGLVLSATSILITLTWPESPAWLAYKGLYDMSKESFHWLRGNSEKACYELDILIRIQEMRRVAEEAEHKHESMKSRFNKIVKTINKKDFTKPTLIIACAFLITEFSGRHIFPAYAAKIMLAFTDNSSQALYSVIGVDSLILITAIASCFVINRFNRRTLLFISGAVSVIFLLLICFYLYLKSLDIVSNFWLPILLLFIYFFSTNIGVAPISLALLGEIYPLKHRGIGMFTSGLLYSLTFLVTLKITPILIRDLNMYGTFFLYSIIVSGALCYLYYYLPETKGKTLEEIENYFNGDLDRLRKENFENENDATATRNFLA